VTRRLLVSYVLLAAFVLAVVELPLGLTYAARQRDRLLADVERDARVLAGLVEERVEAGDAAGVRTIADRYDAQTGGRVVVTDAGGVALVDTSRPDAPRRDFSTRPEVVAALDGTQATGTRRSQTLDQELAYAAVPITSGTRVEGAVRVTFPTDSVRRQVRDNWLRLGLLAGLVLASAAGLGWLVSRWVLQPVEELSEGAQRLAEGDLSSRTGVDRGPPELRRLAATFDEMAARLEELVASQRAFVADASHQLRTPLTALRLRLETLDHVLETEPDAAPGELAAIGAELDRLSRLVEELLRLARAEGDHPAPVRVDLVAAAASAVARWEPLAAEHGVELVLTGDPGPLAVLAVPDGVEQVLDNLIDNALEVSPPAGRIEVDVATDRPAGGGAAGAGARPDDQRDAGVVTVRDHGPGLDEEQRRRATDRFWRAPDAPPGGTGLGLAIAEELLRASGGDLRLEAPGDGPGLRAVVRLPVAPPSTA
jgi:signal transduction histidine kinase